jgi:hypothetical protein
MLEVYDSSGSIIASNDDWKTDPWSGAIKYYGLTPTDDKESATGLSLPAGAYTIQVKGSGGTEGVALVEVYNLGAKPN